MQSLFKTRPGRLFWSFVVPFVFGFLLIAYSGELGQTFLRNELTPWASTLGQAMLSVATIQLLRVALFPYADLASLFAQGSKTPEGSSRLALGICIVFAAMILTFGSTARAGALPGQAERYLPMLIEEQKRYWPEMPMPIVLAAQVEQESRWNPNAKLHTHLELGVGFGQFTKTKRFDALLETKAQFPEALAEWSWDNAYDPRLQFRAMVLKNQSLWRRIVGTATHDDRTAMMLAAYNGGLGGTTRRRLLCRGTAGCDEGRWWGHVEMHDWRSKVVPPGYGKSPSEINTEYPRLVMRVRAPKYAGRM